ncbi:MAG TPA: ERF family protein [Paraburkholderia sp.]|uniref:ERF family protein n=1 Tax=Paraburkholderia sp. TaxID=1926495 RepID=UPI002B46936F|nr:ERF family protein [Paraburkholderia sp.]HKR41010.1 ERF family protein [Paraburkholderia sp.]
MNDAMETLQAFEEQAMNIAEQTDFDVMASLPTQEIVPMPVVQHKTAVATTATPAELLRLAIDRGADLTQLEKLMDLQERYEAKESKRSYDAAFAAFKAEAVVIVKGRKVTDGPLKNKSYAELHDVVNAVTPALSRHGLSSSWKLTKDDKDWMEVTCYLRHVNGHEESVSMGGPPDAGGAKNAIQARASTKTYLERYTLKAITGLSEQEDDDDGRGGKASDNRPIVDKWLAQVKKAKSEKDVMEVWANATPELSATNDLAAFNEVKGAVQSKRADFKAASEAK